MKVTGSEKIMKEAMKERGMVQTKLAGQLGMSQHGLSENINRRRVGLEMFARILGAMGYDVTVTDRETGETKWAVRVENEE